MYPTYRGMSSYPYQRTQMPSSQYYYPGWEATPPQVKEGPAAARPSFMYESWPQNYGYTAPMQGPNCCNHAQYPPAYCNFRPPCSHFQSPPAAYGHICGGYPPYPQPSYPVSYAPPPHYTMELPRYEFDKNAPREFHCCGCPNHSCPVKEGKHVKIEEHEPEVETKKSESLVPAATNNFTYPILWIPRGCKMHKEQQQPRRVFDNEAEKQQVFPYVKKPQWQRRPFTTEAEEQQQSPRVKNLHWQRRPIESEAGEYLESPRVKKPQQSVKTVEQEPNVRYELFPLDMNSIREILEGGKGRKVHTRESRGGDEKNIQDVANKDENNQFPFPIIWMPYGGLGEKNIQEHSRQLLEGGKGRKAYPRESKGGDEKNVQDMENKDQNEQFPFPIILMPNSGQGENHVKGQEEKDVGEAPGKEASPTVKIIPMKFEHLANEPERVNTALGDDGSGVGSRSTKKTINLKTIPVKQLEESVSKPPNKDEAQKDEGTPLKHAEGNGNAQSSSPTKKPKLRPICLRVDPPKKNGNGSSRSPSPPVDKKREDTDESKTGGSKKETEVTEAVDKGPSQSEVKVSRQAGEEKKEKHEGDAEKKGVEGQKSQEAKESKAQEVEKPKRKISSDQEAATITQSAYRGHDVRRWEPLKKLKQIARVREEAAEVKKHIDDLESRAGSSIDEKEKATLAESIMKLLLKLDTIQGLHPSFRDVRRSLAKELIILQEKLDSIINRKSTPVGQEAFAAEEPLKVSGQDEGSKGVNETAQEPSNESGQLEESKVVEPIKEPSNVSGLDESSRDIGETAEGSLKISTQVQSSEGEGKSAEACKEDEVSNLNEIPLVQPHISQDVVGGSEDGEGKSAEACKEDEVSNLNEIPSVQPHISQDVEGGSVDGEGKSAEACKEDEVSDLDEIPSVQPLISQDVVGGSEDEKTLEASPVKMESQNEPQIESASSSPVPAIVDSQADRKEAELDGNETVPAGQAVESQDLRAGADTVENATEQVDMPSEQKVEQVNLLAELREEEAKEDKNEMSQLKVDSITIPLWEEYTESAPSAPTCEAPEVESGAAMKDEGSLVQAELRREVIEEDAKEQISKIPGPKNMSKGQEEQPSGEVKYEDKVTIEPESCKLDQAELSTIEPQNVPEAVPVEIDIPILDHCEPGPEEPTVEKPAPAEVGSQVTEVPEASMKAEKDEESKQSPQPGGSELNSTMTFHENQVSPEEDAPELLGRDQQRPSEEKDVVLPQQMVPSHQNLKDEPVESETEASQAKMTMQGPKDEQQASKESKEGEEEQIDKRIIEEKEKLRQMLERLITSGKEQQDLMSSLSRKVKDLEKKLAKKKKRKSSNLPRVLASRGACVKPWNGCLQDRPMGMAS